MLTIRHGIIAFVLTFLQASVAFGDVTINIPNFPDFPDYPGERRLASAYALKGVEEEWLTLVEACGAFDYEALLYVDTHTFGVATPKEEARLAGCPLMIFHVRFTGEGNLAQKEVLIVKDKENEVRLIEEDYLSVGTYKFFELAQAFDIADPSALGPYNVMSSNCADFITELGAILEVKIDYHVTSWVAGRLLKHNGRELANQIRSNLDYFSSFFSGRNLAAGELADEKLVELLVETRASKLYN